MELGPENHRYATLRLLDIDRADTIADEILDEQSSMSLTKS